MLARRRCGRACLAAAAASSGEPACLASARGGVPVLANPAITAATLLPSASSAAVPAPDALTSAAHCSAVLPSATPAAPAAAAAAANIAPAS